MVENDPIRTISDTFRALVGASHSWLNLGSKPTHLSFEKRSCILAYQYEEGSGVGGIDRSMEVSYPKGYTTVNY